MPSVTVDTAGERVTVSYATAPVVRESRRSGPGYVAIEDLGVPVTAAGLREAVKKPAAEGKQITLPAGNFLFNGYGMGDGNKFMSGVMLNPSIGTRATGFAGTVDTGTGALKTGIGMVPGSSQFTASTYSSGTGNTTQSTQATIWGEGQVAFRFEDFNLLGAKQAHYHHGLRTAGGAQSTLIENVHAFGASQGDNNMPPGEDYTFGVRNATIRNVKGSGKLNGVLHSSTFIGLFGDRSLMEDVEWADGTAGFHTVYWATTGTHVARRCKTLRPGSGPSGRNGNGFNIERATGTYTFDRPEIILDGAWPNPIIGGKRANPTLPNPRHEGKFGHIIIIGEQAYPTKYAPTVIVNDPVFDGWGHPGKAGFHVFRNWAPNATVRVNRNGVTLQRVYLPKWWEAPYTFDPTTQYYESDDVGSSSVWG